MITLEKKERMKEASRRYRLAHPERVRERNARYRASEAGKRRILEYRRQQTESNRSYSKASHRKYRDAVLELLGGVCKRCGFSDSRALQVDHVYGDGNKERVACRNSRSLLAKILYSPERYQLLCANCNWIKREENNEVRKLLPL